MLNNPFKANGITLRKRVNDSKAVSVSTDADGNLVLIDDFVKKTLGKQNGITLREIYTKSKGVYSNDQGQIVFNDSTLSRPYTLEEIVNSCANWKNSITNGSLFWMNRVETDHTSCGNIPLKSTPNSPTNVFFSIDRFLYNLNKNAGSSTCNTDVFVTPDLFTNPLTGEWIWYNVPGLQIVLPPIPDAYKLGQLMAKLSYVSYNSPEPIVFRLYDVTAGIELTRSAVVQCNPCEVSFPVNLLYQGKMIDSSVQCNLPENCGCVKVECVNGDPSCEGPEVGAVIQQVYPSGSHLIQIQFHVFNYQTDHWSRVLGMQQDNNYLSKSTIDAIIYDTNTNLKYGKLNGTAVFTGQKTMQVEFPTALQSSSYSVSLSCNKNINCWWQGKTQAGFIINSELPLTGSVDWTVTNINPNVVS
jgi:hypothetical protein